MRIELSREDVEPFLKGVKNRERCGIMYGVSSPERAMLSVMHIAEVPNRHPEPHLEFRIHSADVTPSWNGHRVVGTIHTHIIGMTAEPSQADLTGLHEESHYGIVLHVPTKRITFYDVDGAITSMKVKDLPSREDVQEVAE